MTRGRPRHHDRPTNIMVSIPETLNAKVELLLYDPTTGKPRYGGRSALIQQLLRDWVEAQQLTQGGNYAIINSSPQDPPPL